jgi:hypothetical protein
MSDIKNMRTNVDRVAYLIIIKEDSKQKTNDFRGSSHNASDTKNLHSSLTGDNNS